MILMIPLKFHDVTCVTSKYKTVERRFMRYDFQIITFFLLKPFLPFANTR